MTTDWNFRNLEHRTELPLPTIAELRVIEKILGRCIHRTWTREQERSGYRSSLCDTCGASIGIGMESRSHYIEPDPVLSDAAVSSMWLSELPRPARVEAVANEVFRRVENAGWSCLITQHGTVCSCSMSKGSERFLSGQQATRSEAIVAAAADSLDVFMRCMLMGQHTKGCMTDGIVTAETWFSMSGRINRGTFLLRAAVLGVCYVGSIAIVAKSGGPVLLAWGLSTVAFVVYLLQAVKRGHDFGANGWTLLLSIVPVVNVLWLLVLACVPGSPKGNRYGPTLGLPEGGPEGLPPDAVESERQRARLVALMAETR